MTLFKFLGVSTIGITTALLVAVAETVIANLTGFNLFGLSFFVILPAGAMLVGAAAASGYYFGCKYFKLRPGPLLTLQMIVVAAATNILIYYLEYQTLVLEDGTRASSLVSFIQYLDIHLTQQELRFGRGMRGSVPTGQFGYWLALIQFIGFLVGGIFVVHEAYTHHTLSTSPVTLNNLSSPTCRACNLPYGRSANVERQVDTADEIGDYYDHLFLIPVDAPEFAARFALGSGGTGRFRITTTLFACPECKQQLWRDEVAFWNGRTWKAIRSTRRSILMPAGMDMTPLLRG